MGKIIADYIGRVKHWIRSAEDFTYEYENYEYDRATDRYYVLVASEDMRSCMDGALVRKRISKSRYAAAYEKAEEEIIKAEARENEQSNATTTNNSRTAEGTQHNIREERK